MDFIVKSLRETAAKEQQEFNYNKTFGFPTELLENKVKTLSWIADQLAKGE
jgi:hypothetical protein